MKSTCKESKQEIKPERRWESRSDHDIHAEISVGKPALINLQRFIGNKEVQRLIERGDIRPGSSWGQNMPTVSLVDISLKSAAQRRKEQEKSGLPDTPNAVFLKPLSDAPIQFKQSEERGVGISNDEPEEDTHSLILPLESESTAQPETSPVSEKETETAHSRQFDQNAGATQTSVDTDVAGEMMQRKLSQAEGPIDENSQAGVAGESSARENSVVPQTDTPQAENSSQPSQANPLESHTTSQTQQLAEDVSNIIKKVMRKPAGSSGTVPSVQRGILGRIGGAVSRGIGWITRNVVEPIRRVTSSGVQAVTEFSRRFASAYAQADAPEWDIQRRAFQALSSVRNQLYEDVIARQRVQRSQAVQEGRMTPAQAAEPTALERIDAAADAFESGVDTVLGVQSEIVEGAVLGDFKENPTIWNTIGQIAIGFVPYAGQVADVRDLVASIRKLSTGGWRDPWEWVNLVLVGVGFIPGLGDIVKAGGRGAMRFLREAGPAILRRGREIWQQVARRVPQLIDGARRFGRRLLDSAANAGRRLINGARNLARRAINGARRVGNSIRSAISRTRNAISSLGRAIRERARSVVSRARGLLGRIGSAISDVARRAYEGARGLMARANDLAQRGIARGREVIGRLRRRITDMANQARRFVTETLPAAARRARDFLGRARRRMAEAISRRIAQGRRMLGNAYRGARDFVSRQLRALKDRAVRVFREHIQPLPRRIEVYLRRKYLKLRGAPSSPSMRPDPGRTPGGRRTTNNPGDDAATRRSLARENDSADTLSRNGFDVEQNPNVPGNKNPDYRIEGRVFDNYAPSTRNPRNIYSEIQGKVDSGQASRIVLNLSDSGVDMAALRRQFADWPMRGLEEIIIVRGNDVIRFYP